MGFRSPRLASSGSLLRMDFPLPGLHHLTAVASEPQANLDFYAGLLGLRLVKQTVNFDDPGTYHLYYGDERGRPGSLLTFFASPEVPPGMPGSGAPSVLQLSAPEASLFFWQDRLEAAGVATSLRPRWEETVLAFRDPDGLPVELVGAADDSRPPWTGGPLPAEYALRGLAGVEMAVAQSGPTERFLRNVLGGRPHRRDDTRTRIAWGEAAPGHFLDLVATPDLPASRGGAGTLHHLALRAPDPTAQDRMDTALRAAGVSTSGPRDRQYFRSVYFREPGGVLLEIATDPPGFTVDESPAELGTRLCLPHGLEPHRGRIERRLPPLLLSGIGENRAGEKSGGKGARPSTSG